MLGFRGSRFLAISTGVVAISPVTSQVEDGGRIPGVYVAEQAATRAIVCMMAARGGESMGKGTRFTRRE